MTDETESTWGGLARNLVITAMILPAVSLVAAYLVFQWVAPPVPDFGTDLPFRDAALERFPVGTPVAEIVPILVEAGFTITGRGTLTQPVVAVLERSSLLCVDRYVIEWTADAATGAVTDLAAGTLLGCGPNEPG